jgi:hypothetical protein
VTARWAWHRERALSCLLVTGFWLTGKSIYALLG